MANEKKVKRIWQSPKGPNCHTTLTVLQVLDISNMQKAKLEISLAPNTAGQYVIRADAIQYEDQIAKMEEFAAKHGLYEIDAKKEGQIPASYIGMETPGDQEQVVSTLKAALLKAEKENAAMMKKLADIEDSKDSKEHSKK
jgi:hypothetical protein